MSNNEYSGVTNTGSCSYPALNNYNSGYAFGFASQPKIVTGSYVVPLYDPINYNSLTSPVPTCSGYPNIMSAYGKDAGQCQTQYRVANCMNGNSKQQ